MLAEVLKADSTVQWADSLEQTSPEVGAIYESEGEYYKNISQGGWESCVNPKGEIIIKLQLTLKIPVVNGILTDMKMVELRQSSIESLSVNFGALLKDEDSADLKIVTRDEKTFLAHKLILKGLNYNKNNLKGKRVCKNVKLLKNYFAYF